MSHTSHHGKDLMKDTTRKGSAVNDDVMNHYNSFKKLNLTEQEKKDLVEYLKAL
jgi:hypothetical protein